MKRLSGWDAMLLYSETPNVPTHTLKVVVVDTSDYDRPFTFDLFRHVLEERLPVLEPLRYRLINIPLRLHHPMWLEDCDVDLDHHLRRVTVPGPGGRRELDDLVAEVAQASLGRGRPLWEVYFVEGMADRKVALIAKVHHALADGVASANLMARAMDPLGPAGDDGGVDACLPPSRVGLVRAAGRDHVKQLKRFPAVISDTAAGIGRVRRRAAERGKHPELARAFSPPPTFMNHVVSPGRRFATATLALSDAKQTGKRLGITLNDLVLSMSAGALRELLLRYDGEADQPIIASVPVSTDPSPHRMSGNALGGMFVSLPVHLDDALERVRLVGVSSAIAKENTKLLGADLLGRWTNYLPPLLAPLVFRWLAKRRAQNKLHNVSISNVRGPSERGRIAKRAVGEFYSVGPLTPGTGVNITVWSYVDQLNVSVLTDDRSVRDAHEVSEAMIHAFAEIRCAAGLPSKLTEVETAMSQALSPS